jgi:hypothetical protein
VRKIVRGGKHEASSLIHDRSDLPPCMEQQPAANRLAAPGAGSGFLLLSGPRATVLTDRRAWCLRRAGPSRVHRDTRLHPGCAVLDGNRLPSLTPAQNSTATLRSYWIRHAASESYAHQSDVHQLDGSTDGDVTMGTTNMIGCDCRRLSYPMRRVPGCRKSSQLPGAALLKVGR